ncbi:FHA domain-containing protein [Streptomyces sp. MUM 203J]|uniref:FHA domain-containing protein n=1 Tax=Streptomyces sp. MUM 203J TaxID=2791990 RepID=UPI001F03B433|nr:FHA domain-containing protein [Streptomyces sp. MUM 203J]MCH0541200.1 FHA domain-containing protein [Streptomyces sp. MUM 203J]
MPTCPNGHQSPSGDWCEVCGHRMAGAGAAPPPPPPPPAPGYGYPPPPPAPMAGDPNATQQAELCPQCRTPREPLAQFCAECRWSFTPGPGPGGPGTHGGPGGPGGPGTHGGPGGPGGPGGFGVPGGPGDFGGPAGPGRPDGHGGSGGPGGPGYPSGPGDFGTHGTPSGPGRPGDFGTHGGPGAPGRPGNSGGFDGPGAPGGPGGPGISHRPGGPNDFGAHGGPGGSGRPDGHGGPGGPGAFDGTGGPGSPGGPGGYGPPGGPGRADGHGGTGAYGAQGAPSGVDLPPGFQSPPPAQPGPYQDSRPPQVNQPAGEGADDWLLPPPSHGQQAAPVGWSVSVAPDREYFTAMMRRSGPEAAGLSLPAYSPDRRVPLTGGQVSIGRRRQSTGEAPDIDLSVAPEDPGVSHQHALLVQQPDGAWAVVDQNSTNGTTVNGGEDPIQPYVPVPLQEGDRVHVGAWTTITVRRG